MNLKYFFIFILFGITSLGFAASTAKEEKSSKENTKSDKEEKSYTFRFAWWEMPSALPDLYIQEGSKYIAIAPYSMEMSPEIELNVKDSLKLLKKVPSTEKDSNGRPKDSYETYSDINLSQTDSHNLGIILIPDKKRNVVGSRVFDFSPRGFPFGSLITVNFTRSNISCIVDDAKFNIPSGGFSRLPKNFTERSVAFIGIKAINKDGVENQIVSTKAVFTPYVRSIYFIVENPPNSVNAYDVRCMVDVNKKPTIGNSTEETKADSKAKK
jgi:hypothetical protein